MNSTKSYSTTFKLGILLSSVLLVQSCSTNDYENHPDKPNIIFIVADDLGYGDLSCYGQQKFDTPNIDKLASQGMLFTQYYAGSTVCAPSRASLMTGLHTGHTQIRGNKGIKEGQFPFPLNAVTLPKLLKKEGYYTGAFGKWGLGYPGSSGDPLNQGFDEFFGYNSQTIAHNYYPTHLYHNNSVIELEENRATEKGVYAPDLIHQKTLEFIETHKDTSFFLFIPSILPHAELVAPSEYMELFLKNSGQDSLKTSVFSPEGAYEGIDDPNDTRYKLGGYGSQSYPRAAFAAMIKVLDDQVGEILDKLEDLGLAENTLVIFTSDNGPHQEGGADPDFFNSNGPFRGYKRDLYEGGIRVPMLAKWPKKIPSGIAVNHISSFWDVLPTLCDLIGINTPTNIDGISFLPTLLGDKNQAPHDYLYWEFHEQNGKQAVRMGDWKAIRLNTFNEESDFLLFDLSKDPQETNNLASVHPEKSEELGRIMDISHTEDPEWPFSKLKR